MEKENYTEAINCFDQVKDLKEKARVHYIIGEVLQREKKLHKALKHYEEAINIRINRSTSAACAGFERTG